MDLDVPVQRLLELARGAMSAAAHAALRERGEPALHLVEPRRRGRGEVNVEARMTGEPVLDGRRLVGAVVVHHQVDVEYLRHARINGAQELQELAAAVAPVRLADDSAGGDVVGGKQSCGAVALVVVRAALGDPGSQGQHRLRAVQGLDLALLVHAQHHGHVRRVHVQAHDVTHLVHEQRVGGELEGLLPVGLQPKSAPDARHRALRHAKLSRDEAGAPVRGTLRHALQRLGHHCIHPRVIDRARGARAWGIEQPIEPVLDESCPPLRHGLLSDAVASRHSLVVRALRAGQHDARTQGQRLRRLAAQRQRRELLLLSFGQHQFRLVSSAHQPPRRAHTEHA